MHDFTIESLVLDAAPLLSTAASSSVSALRGLANQFITTPDVVAEIRDKTSRELFNSTLQILGLESSSDLKQAGGLQVRSPQAEAIAQVTAFAKLTGDIAVLSQADIRVLALTYALEVEQNGTRRLRSAPGKLSQEEQERENKKQERLAKVAAEKASKPTAQPEEATEPKKEDVEIAEVPQASTSSSPPPKVKQDDDKDDAKPEVVVENNATGEQEDDEDSEGDGEWITPENVTLHKSRDSGLFPTLPSHHPDAMTMEEGSANGKKKKQKPILKVACLTGDYAMQNVALQMGLNVFGVGGKKIKEVKTWVLRCHACFKICKDPTKKFCPSCGNPTLIRTSITYVTPSPENPKGYILHLKANFQYHLRGTQYSLPSPKPSSSNAMKNPKNAAIILREDQKEYQRGLKTADFAKQKQERAAAKALREGRGGGSSSVFGGWDDPDWTPDMLYGDKGRLGGGQPGVRTGKDGMPIIGHGRRNPNENRKKAK